MLGILLPDSDRLLDEDGSIKNWVIIVSTATVLCTVAIYGVILSAASSMSDLFEGFDSSLPLLTRLVLDYAKFSIVLALVGIVPLFSMWRTRSPVAEATARNLILILASLGIASFIAGITYVAMYLPIFETSQQAS